MDENLLLESYLKQLRLPVFLKNWRKFAEDAAQTHLSYDRYLLSLAEQEIAQREKHREDPVHAMVSSVIFEPRKRGRRTRQVA